MSARWLWALVLAGLFACTTSVDPGTARPYPCDPDAGDSQCPSDWRCGLEGYCHSRDAGAAYECLSDSDCELGWHCGEQGFCYDLSDAGAVPCRPDAGDCAPGWRCGLSGACHDTSVAAAYACGSDSDCEGGWRCGPDGICLDASAEALRPTPPLSALVSSRVSPAWSGLPDDYAVSPPTNFLPTFQQPMRIHSELRDGGLLHVRQIPIPAPASDTYADATLQPLRSQNVYALAAAGLATHVLDDQGLWSFWIQADGGPTSAPGELSVTPAPGETLRVTDESADTWPLQVQCSFPPPTNLLMLVAPTAFEFWDTGTLPLADSGTQTILNGPTLNDVVGFWAPNSRCEQDLMAATSDGLFVAERVDGGAFRLTGTCVDPTLPCWQPIELPPLLNAQCDAGSVIAPLRLATRPFPPGVSFPNFPIAARVAPPGGGTGDYVAMLQLNPPYSIVPFPDPITACSPVSDQGSSLTWASPCAACLPGESLVDFHPSNDNDVITRCRGVANGVAFEALHDVAGGQPLPDGGSACVIRTEVYSQLFANGEPTTPAYSTASAEFADSFGRDWHSEQLGDPTNPQLGDVALTPNDAPQLLLGSLSSVLRARVGSTVGDGVAVPFLSSYIFSPGVGLASADVNATDEADICGGVAGEPWMLTNNEQASGPLTGVIVTPLSARSSQGAIRIGSTPPPPVVQLNDSSDIVNSGLCGEVQSAAVQGMVAPLPDGGTEMLAISQDTLWAGDVTPLATADGGYDGGTLFLDIRASPFPRLVISSAVAVPPSAAQGTAGDLLDGYLLIEGHLMRFRARSQTLWDTDELFPPSGQPTGLWTDGPRGRAAMSDGTVYSLPSLVPIAAPLPGSAQPVSDWAGLCGTGYALTASGVYQLAAPTDGGVLGSWAPVPLGASLTPSEAAQGFAGGHFYADPPRLLVISPTGTVAAITDTTCP